MLSISDLLPAAFLSDVRKASEQVTGDAGVMTNEPGDGLGWVTGAVHLCLTNCHTSIMDPPFMDPPLGPWSLSNVNSEHDWFELPDNKNCLPSTL